MSQEQPQIPNVLACDVGNSGVRIAAAGALGTTGQATSNLFLLNILQNTQDPDLIASCMRSIGQLRDYGSVGVISSYLQTTHPTLLRGTAADTLGRLGSEKAVKPLMDTLATDPDPTVRSLAARSLGLLIDPKAEDVLTDAILFDGSEVVRYRAAEALLAYRRSNALREVFLDSIRDSDKRVRYLSLVALSDNTRDVDIPAIAELLDDEKKGIRDLAQEILSRKGVVLERIGDRYRMVR